MNRHILVAALAVIVALPLFAGSDSPSAEQQQHSIGTHEEAAAQPRDPDAYADGYEYTNMPGMEKSDQLAVGRLLVDEMEYVPTAEGNALAWEVYGSYGRDEQKLWLRTEGSLVDGEMSSTASAEALWWRPFAPFWATLLGVRQDLGRGPSTHAAFGIEGLAPYWFEVQLTGYVATEGTVSARVKASYDLLLTNRVVLTPEVSSNLFSEANDERRLGSGISNAALEVRLRYEARRKFAPYIGFEWDRTFGDTAGFRRGAGEDVNEVNLVVGVRAWR